MLADGGGTLLGFELLAVAEVQRRARDTAAVRDVIGIDEWRR